MTEKENRVTSSTQQALASGIHKPHNFSLLGFLQPVALLIISMPSFLPPSSGAGVLNDILRQNNVYLGGSAMGKGFRRAARYYLQEHVVDDDCSITQDIPSEDSFYVVDIGVVVSQFYQWREHFSRVQCFYAIKCNPDPVLIQTLAILGAHFDCASKQEIQLVCQLTAELPRQPEIIYANPCKARSHILEAVQRGVTLMTFDNVNEVSKCASISKDIRLILRIITDDVGSQCRLSSKYGAPRGKWRELLQAARDYGLPVVGVSFHVGSGCRDATRYELALKDAKELVDMAKKEFGFDMTIVDIGGGFPGESHSLWNPAARDPVKANRGIQEEKKDSQEVPDTQFMFFDEIAAHVSPLLDEIFPESSGIRLIAEPGRYLVAASCTLLTNVIAVRSNIVDETQDAVTPISDSKVAAALDTMTREQEDVIVRDQGMVLEEGLARDVVDEMTEYARLFARQNLSQQEIETYTHERDFSQSAPEELLAPPEEWLPAGVKAARFHTAEGVASGIVADCLSDFCEDVKDSTALMALAAAGEAAVAGVVLQSVADSVPIQDDFSYYVNDGVYGAFNNIMFDHATVRPRPLRSAILNDKRHGRQRSVSVFDSIEGFHTLEDSVDTNSDPGGNDDLYTSTIFGPTCDAIDVISRSVLLPKLNIGDWLYFNNMGAYTMAAASSFNGFSPTEKFYVCSVQPEYFERLLGGPDSKEMSGCFPEVEV